MKARILSDPHTIQRIGVLLITGLLCLHEPCLCRATDEAAVTKLETILGSPTNEWRIVASDYRLAEEKGTPVLVAGPGSTILTSLAKVDADSEVIVRLRLGAAEAKTTSFHFAPALKTPDDATQNLLFLSLTTPAGKESEPILCQMPAIPGQHLRPLGVYQFYIVRTLPKSRLTWPEIVRARVEEDFASVPSLGKRWLTIRYVVRKNAAQVYLDGRLLRDTGAPLSGEGTKRVTIDPEGYLRLKVSDGAQLASVRVRKLPPEDPIFVTVPLDDSLNASEIKGERIQPLTASEGRAHPSPNLSPEPFGHELRAEWGRGTSSNAAGARISSPRVREDKGEGYGRSSNALTLGGVSFLLPTPDESGNDHFDVGRSWMRFGALEGAFDGMSYDSWPARWQGALSREAGRICFNVRNAPYSRLHLLAAFDGEADKTPVVTAQFYRQQAGLPVSFSARVPLFTARSSKGHALPVRLTGGGRGNLHLVTIPLEPEGLAAFSDLDYLEFELTKETRIYRAFPDPAYYSEHGAGLPSGVRVYGMTLERPAVEVDLQPEKFAHIWTAPEKPSYAIHFRNNTSKGRETRIELATLSHDGTAKTSQKKSVRVPEGGQETITLPVELKRYGYHRVELRVKDDQGVRTQTRSLAYLHPDTRERGGWEEGKGPLFGFWDMKGGQGTPGGIPRLQAAVAAGAESTHALLVDRKLHGFGYPPEELAFAETHGMVTHFLDHQASLTKAVLGVDFDASKPAEMEARYIEALKKVPFATPTKLNKPEYAMFFGEPHLGPVTYMSLPEYYGDPPYQMTEAEQANYKIFLDQFLIGARAVKKTYPHVKCFMPWGTPTFMIPFLRNSKEATELLDGPAIDMALFERLPEMQMHQITYASVFWQFKQEWIKAGKPWPLPLTLVEGGQWTAPATPGALTMEEEADRTVRAGLILCAYGVTRHYSRPKTFRLAESYGEQHYGGGLCERLPLLNPKPAYVAYATMTRQLNRMNYVKTIETGSASVFCLQFKHYKTGELLHVLWTLRGTRTVSLEASPASRITHHDSMDNSIDLTPLINTPPKRAVNESGQLRLTISSSPCYLRGLTGDARITLGEPDHSDVRPAKLSRKLSNLGSGWTISQERDNDYETAWLDFVRKFTATMRVQVVSAPSEAGGKALAVHLEKPKKERKTMPFYTTLVPEKPITIAGKASHLGLWVRAASDWGRFVYCLRDANGERWVSVGKKGEWNCDDIHCWSAFNFDGWRYLRFELPGNQPWDCFRDAGTSFWGYYGQGDGIVDLPLSLEKIIVERRTHVIRVDDLIPANPEDVLLGDLVAEYERETDRGEEAIRLSRLRMPKPIDPPAIDNPIQKLAETGVGQPVAITKVEPPTHEYDGTRCHVFFEPVAGARSYDVWVSTYADGRGAVRQGENWIEPVKLLMGLPPSVELYLFITYADADGKLSKPSAARRILLRDDFPFK